MSRTQLKPYYRGILRSLFFMLQTIHIYVENIWAKFETISSMIRHTNKAKEQKRRVGMYRKNKGFCHKLIEMASGLCPNKKHVFLHSPTELANQNEDSCLSPCSSSASGQQRCPLAGEVVASLLQQLPQQEYLSSANGRCPPPRRNSAPWCLSKM